MARFPVDKTKLPAIGAALAKAVTDPSAKEAYIANPSGYLIEAGVDESAIASLVFNVIEDTDKRLNLVLPSAVDTAKVDANDEEYLTLLGNTVVLGCALSE